MTRIVRKDGDGYERVVFAEVLVPETPNVFNDWWSRESIKEAAYLCMQKGFGIDVEHDNVDVSNEVCVVESFIARAGDPDFIEGSWVVAMQISSDDLWERVLNNDLNGFSYEALVSFMPGTLDMEDDGDRFGTTEPDIEDGHTHTFWVMVDLDNRPVAGGTDVVNGHSHEIKSSTVTETSAGHSHRYNLVAGEKGK